MNEQIEMGRRHRLTRERVQVNFLLAMKKWKADGADKSKKPVMRQVREFIGQVAAKRIRDSMPVFIMKTKEKIE